MSQITRFNNYISEILPQFDVYDVTDKSKAITQHIAYMLCRTQSMFKWTNLPETIPQRNLELFLQTQGNVTFAKYKDDFYVFLGGLGGEPDVYYMPTISIVANPALKLSETFKINEDCVVIPNDSLYYGLLPMFTKYATQFAETELSMYLTTINSRTTALISAQDDRTKASAEKYIEDIKDGKQSVIAESAFLDGIRIQPYGTTGNSNFITNLIELLQYQKASLYNEIGLNANYNMKRESLNSGESQLNNDLLFPFVDDMLTSRKKACEKINELFGLDIDVELKSSWADNVEEIKKELEEIDADETEEIDAEETDETEEIEEEKENEEEQDETDENLEKEEKEDEENE